MATEKDTSGTLRALDGSPRPETWGKQPPQALDSESMVLAEILREPDGFDRVQGILPEEGFYSDANRKIFGIIMYLHQQNMLVDVTTVAQIARERGCLDQIGGTPYLVDVVTTSPAVGPYLEQHASKVRDMWRRRRVIATAQRIAVEGYGDVGDDQAWVESVEEEFSRIAHEHSPRRIVSVGEVAADEVFRIGEAHRHGTVVSGISTGYAKLDHLISGLHGGDLYVVAGRPGMGKTSFATSLLMNVSKPQEGTPRRASILFSLEQPKEQIAMRVLCAGSGADFGRIRKNHFHTEDYERMTDYLGTLSTVPLYIDDQPAITLMDLRSEVRKLQRQIESGVSNIPADKLGLIAVDYLQLMQAEKLIRKRGTREEEVSSFTQGLKGLAKELGVPVLALSQLNRRVELRPDKRPQLSDLRESGAIEQDADTIMFLYRDSYYEKTRTDNRCEVIVAKQRNGPTDSMELAFDRDTMSFRSLTTDEDIGGESFDEYEEDD